LIHCLYEESVRKQLIEDGLAKSLVKEHLYRAVGTLEEKLGDVQVQLVKDGIIPPSLEDPIQFAKNIEAKLLQPVKDQLDKDEIARKIGEKILQPVQAIKKNKDQSNESREEQGKDNGNDEQEEASDDEGGIANEIATIRETRGAIKPHSGIDLERESTLGYSTNLQEANQFLIPLLNTALSLDNPEEKFLIAEGARYISFATGIYYWSTKDNEPWWYPLLCRRHYVQNHKSDHRGQALKASVFYFILFYLWLLAVTMSLCIFSTKVFLMSSNFRTGISYSQCRGR
jgi:hypothetical protein